jgi:hypothetical protein
MEKQKYKYLKLNNREDLDYLVGLKRKMKDGEVNGKYNEHD